MSNTPTSQTPPPGQGNIPLEYTRATGAYFPGGSTTTAATTGVSSAIGSINGDTSSAITLQAGPSSGATVNIQAPGNGAISIGVSVTGNVFTLGTSFPASPQNGQSMVRTDLGHLFVYYSGTWNQM